MTTDILIVQNIGREKPGLLEDVLRENDLSFQIVDLTTDESFPDPTSYKALIVLGGPPSANDTDDRMIEELSQIKKALNAGVPYLGICLGLQTLVSAAGGQIIKAEHKEVGFKDSEGQQFIVELTEAGQADSLLSGLPKTLEVFQLHGEAVELTDNMQLLATGKWCRNQIVKVGKNAYGIQSHFEVTPKMLAVWAEEDPDLIPIGKDRLLAEYQSIQASYVSTGKKLMRNFIALVNHA